MSTEYRTPRGVGNQVSCEFNLLYRFHSGVSKRDDAWTRDFFGNLFPGQNPTTGVPQLLQGLKAFENTILKKPKGRLLVAQGELVLTKPVLSTTTILLRSSRQVSRALLVSALLWLRADVRSHGED